MLKTECLGAVDQCLDGRGGAHDPGSFNQVHFTDTRGLVQAPHTQTWPAANTLQKRESIIFIGNPGLGKTHLSIGLALAACRQKRKVRFWTAASLVNQLLQAQDEHRLHRFIAQALKLDLVALDELGFIPFSADGAHALFTFCSELYERLPFIISTNLKFADWVQVFGSERLTAALLDRLTHHAHSLELLGESHRFRQRMQQEANHE